MKAKHVIIYLLLVIVTSSCIRDEAPNAEADILSCRLPGITMTTSPIINNTRNPICHSRNEYLRPLHRNLHLLRELRSHPPVVQNAISIRRRNIK